MTTATSAPVRKRREPPIVRVCRRLTLRYGLSSELGAVNGPRWRRVEVAMHEVAHGFTFGLDMTDPLMSEHVSNKHKRMNGKDSDAAEIETCALEALVLQRFRVPVTVEMLAVTASKMMRTTAYPLHDHHAVERDIKAAMQLEHVRELAWRCERFIRQEARR